jgi:NAD(P)-dependent dehydrogenase (short-subunit alcohol dehydrogenase family)
MYNLNFFEKYSLEGKTALITGAAGLLGTEHGYALLSVGARLILTDVSEEALQETKKKLLLRINNLSQENIFTYKMDVTNQQDINRVATSLTNVGCRVDILINNAAIDPKVKPDGMVEASRLENFSLDQWNIEVAVGLTGAFLCSQVFGSLMALDGEGGVILNIASDLSVFSPDQRLYKKDCLADDMQPVKPVTYSVIKSGLVGLTRYLSTYWVEQGVRANALSPGGVFTNQDEAFVKKLTSLIPMARMATLDDYHGAIQFLCSSASSYMNGQNVVIDGGRSVW